MKEFEIMIKSCKATLEMFHVTIYDGGNCVTIYDGGDSARMTLPPRKGELLKSEQ